MKTFVLFIMWLLWFVATCTLVIPVWISACGLDWFALGNNIYKSIVNE